MDPAGWRDIAPEDPFVDPVREAGKSVILELWPHLIYEGQIVFEGAGFFHSSGVSTKIPAQPWMSEGLG
jgi:hypothetical protein